MVVVGFGCDLGFANLGLGVMTTYTLYHNPKQISSDRVNVGDLLKITYIYTIMIIFKLFFYNLKMFIL
jgi:hypothetical protein